jgi:hypothetical protein
VLNILREEKIKIYINCHAYVADVCIYVHVVCENMYEVVDLKAI